MQWESGGVVTVLHQADPKQTDSQRSQQTFTTSDSQFSFLSPAAQRFTKCYSNQNIQRNENKSDAVGNQ